MTNIASQFIQIAYGILASSRCSIQLAKKPTCHRLCGQGWFPSRVRNILRPCWLRSDKARWPHFLHVGLISLGLVCAVRHGYEAEFLRSGGWLRTLSSDRFAVPILGGCSR